MVEIVTRACFRPGERPDRLSSRDLRQKFLALGFRSGLRDDPPREHDCFEERLDHEMAAELLHDDHARQDAFAKTAELFRQGRRQQANLGKRVPMLSAKTLLGPADLTAQFAAPLPASPALTSLAHALL